MNTMTSMRIKAFASLLLLIPILASQPLLGQQGTTDGDWRVYGGDAGGTKYSPLDEINAENVAELEIVWRWKANNFGPRPDYNWQATPLAIDGVLYTTAGSRKHTRGGGGGYGCLGDPSRHRRLRPGWMPATTFTRHP